MYSSSFTLGMSSLMDTDSQLTHVHDWPDPECVALVFSQIFPIFGVVFLLAVVPMFYKVGSD